MKTYDITIIGFGITGMLLLPILKKEGFENICIIDPYFDGGDLLRLWGDILSNTPLQKAIDALKLIDPSYTLPTVYDPTKITPLSLLVHIVKDFSKSFLHHVDIYETTVKKLEYNELWTVINEDLSNIKSNTIILCQGSEPKKIKCSIPSIPLHIALNKNLLKTYVKPNDKVLLFGTSHSGVLILENLEQLQVHTTAVYKGVKPFYFAKDGDYDGIKEEAYRIASEILNNVYTYVHLHHIHDTGNIIKASKEADWVINSIGFEARNIETTVNGLPVSLRTYDSKTGALVCPKAFGFGIAYPSLAPDNIHVDVGLFSFVEHILKQIPNLKTILNR